MKKKNIFRIASCVLMTAALLTGCGKGKDIVLYGSEEQFGKAELCDYSKLSVTKNVYEISDQMVDEQIDSLAAESMDYTSVDRAAQEDDIVTLSMKISDGGNVIYDFTEESEGSYELSLGYEEFGAEFDQKITGAKKGDHLTFSVSYDEDSEFEEFAGKTIDYDVTVDAVSIEETPELTPDFIKNNLGYDSEEALRKGVKDDLVAQYEQTSRDEVKSELLSQIIEGSTFGEYSQETLSSYKSSIEENYASYMEMFGASTLQEVYEMFSLTDEDIENEALDQAKRDTVINQIGREQDLRMPQKDYDQRLSELAKEYEYGSKDEMIEDYGEDALKAWLLEEAVCDYLIEHANITENKLDASLLDGGFGGEDYFDEEDDEGYEEGLLLGDDDEAFDDIDFEDDDDNIDLLDDDEEDIDDADDADFNDADYDDGADDDETDDTEDESEEEDLAVET